MNLGILDLPESENYRFLIMSGSVALSVPHTHREKAR